MKEKKHYFCERIFTYFMKMTNFSILGITVLLFAFSYQKPQTYSLTVEVRELQNSNGVMQFALYNRPDGFPDEHYKTFYRKLTAAIVDASSTVIFENLPQGKYAVKILHDEDSDGKIKKRLFLPKEGIGFSNYESVGLSNRPAFDKAALDLTGDKKICIKIIYL
ncbi:MAG TPA: DUF2141 domain-containing protein [Flavobacterium sp.]|nr:DUF2141 domain-containing protein [Flavobacterium sp.]